MRRAAELEDMELEAVRAYLGGGLGPEQLGQASIFMNAQYQKGEMGGAAAAILLRVKQVTIQFAV